MLSYKKYFERIQVDNLKQLIKHFNTININSKEALIIDWDSDYLDGKLSSCEVFNPYRYFSKKDSVLKLGDEEIAPDYANDIGECIQLCSLYDVVVLSKPSGCYVGKRLSIEKYNKIAELKDSRKNSKSNHYYTLAGIHTVTKVMESEYPDRLIGLALSKKELEEKVL